MSSTGEDQLRLIILGAVNARGRGWGQAATALDLPPGAPGTAIHSDQEGPAFLVIGEYNEITEDDWRRPAAVHALVRTQIAPPFLVAVVV